MLEESQREAVLGPSPGRARFGTLEPVKAIGAMALLPICDSSFTCEDYNTYGPTLEALPP